MPLPTIAIGVDFSEGSRRALQAVATLARGTPASLRLIHAFPPGKPRLRGEALRELRASVTAAEMGEVGQLSTLAERLRKQGYDVETMAIEGKAAATLLAQARRSKAGLIAVGTSGHRGLKGLFLGSVAQAVLRASPVPVLVTPARHRRGSRRAGPVLAAVDLDDTAPSVLGAAAGLANDLGVAMHAFHAVHIPFIGPAFPETGVAFTPAMLEEDEEDAAVRLTSFVEPLRKDLDVKTSVGIGDAPTHVLALAQQIGAAAIVVGRRKAGRRLGSVSGAVVQAEDRPVIVVPAGFSVPKGKGGKTIGFAPSGR